MRLVCGSGLNRRLKSVMTNHTSLSPSAAAQEADHFDLTQVTTVAGGHLVHDTFSAFLNPLLPLIVEKLHLSLALAGSLTLFTRLPSLLNPFIGLWADRIDLRLLVILAPTVTAATMSLIGLAPNYAVLALLLLASGLSSSALHVPGPVIISRVAGRRVGTGMSIWMVGGELARMVGPLMAVAVVSWLTLEGYYPVMILGMATSAVLFWRLRPVALQAPAGKRPTPLREAWRTLRRLLLPMGLILLLRTFVRSGLGPFLPLLVTAEGASLWVGGTSLAVVELAGALGALTAGMVSDRVDRRWVLFVALLCSPLFMLAFLATRPMGGALPYLMLALTGYTTLSTTPVFMALAQEHGRKHPATANGLYMGISFLIDAFCAPLFGWIGDQIGLGTAYMWGALIALLAVPLAFLLPRLAVSDQVGQGAQS
jgi:MFS transporter, FSR family, fosmidomycin resistance protein